MSRLFSNAGRLDTAIAAPAGSFWLSAWFKRSLAATDTIFGLFPTGTGDGFYVQVSAAGVAQAVVSAGGSAVNSAATLAISDTTLWHHVVAAFIGSGAYTSSVWIDGGNKGSQVLTRTPVGVDLARIGGRADNTSFFSGRIAHVVAGNGTPTDADVLAMYRSLPPDVLGAAQFFYAPLVENRTPEIDDIGGLSLTITNAVFDTDNPAIVPQVASTPFTGGFLYAYERARAARRKRLQEEEELEEQARALQDKVDREIALLLRAAEAEQARQAELDRLQGLVRAHSNAQLQLSDRAKIAYVRALTQANFSAMEALDRELQRMIEEEEITALMILLNED